MSYIEENVATKVDSAAIASAIGLSVIATFLPFVIHIPLITGPIIKRAADFDFVYCRASLRAADVFCPKLNGFGRWTFAICLGAGHTFHHARQRDFYFINWLFLSLLKKTIKRLLDRRFSWRRPEISVYLVQHEFNDRFYFARTDKCGCRPHCFLAAIRHCSRRRRHRLGDSQMVEAN